jgi:hypothetical protein
MKNVELLKANTCAIFVIDLLNSSRALRDISEMCTKSACAFFATITNGIAATS